MFANMIAGAVTANASAKRPTISGVPSFAMMISIAHWHPPYMKLPPSVHRKFVRNDSGRLAGAARGPVDASVEAITHQPIVLPEPRHRADSVPQLRVVV